MADNVTVDNTTNGDYGVVSDEITSPYTGGSKQAQGVKLLDGTVDSNTVIKAGGGVEANALRVTVASDSTGKIIANPTRSATATTSQVADNAASVTLLAANANRLGASITNDSSARLYLKAGTTASTTDYTVSLLQHDHWEVPFGYTGKVDGIWASDPGDGAARVTEYTA